MHQNISALVTHSYRTGSAHGNSSTKCLVVYLSLPLRPCFSFSFNAIEFQQLHHKQLRQDNKFFILNLSPSKHALLQVTHLLKKTASLHQHQKAHDKLLLE